MAKPIFVIQRFDMATFDRKAFDSRMKDWVKRQSGRIQSFPEYSLIKKITKVHYEVAGPGWVPLFIKSGGLQSNLMVFHEERTLYIAYVKGAFPEIYENFLEAVVAPFVSQFGGKRLDPSPVVLDTSKIPFSDRMMALLTKNTFKFIKDNLARQHPVPGDVSQKQDPTAVNVNLDSELEKVQAASEEVSVPPGVRIKVKRSRTIEHTLDINWAVSGGVSIDAGLQKIISASIKGGIERRQGKSYKTSELIEYEVELNGDQHSHYKLTWTDNWRKGYVELPVRGTTRIIPFKFKEWAELIVQPLEG